MTEPKYLTIGEIQRELHRGPGHPRRPTAERAEALRATLAGRAGEQGKR